MIFTCTICPKSFDSPLRLGGHIGSHGRAGKKRTVAKDFVCITCGDEFKSLRNPKHCSLSCYRALASTKRKARLFVVETTYHKKATLDVTVGYIEEYKNKQKHCEICGSIIRLAVDHDHKDGKFRGILCYSCNTQLGWYEKNQQSILRYLDR